MAVLLDTNVLVWVDTADRRLGAKTRSAVENAARSGGAFICPISFWEVGLAVEKGRLELDTRLGVWRENLLKAGYQERAVTGADCVAMAELVDFHADPADRLIVAVAMISALTLVTSDRKILSWSGALKRLDART